MRSAFKWYPKEVSVIAINYMNSQKNTTIAMILAIVVIILFLSLGFFGLRSISSTSPDVVNGGTTDGQPTDGQAQQGPSDILNEISSTGTVADLRIFDVIEGDGQEAKVGDTIVVHYTGILPDGTVFDSSRDRGQPFSFQLGGGQVIQGWEQGFTNMKIGGRRILAIPPQFGYGTRSVGSIPANATLLFDVELLDIVPSQQ